MSKATGIAALVITFTAGAILFAFWLTKGPRQFNADTYGFSSSGKDLWTYDDLRSVLETVDNNGLVNYRRLKANRTALDRFTVRLAKLDRKTFDTWGNLEQMSLWINAYNGLTLLAIINHYPIQSSFLASLRFPENSIRQISGVWNRLEFEVMGRSTTLDHIEHEILRKEFDDPRIHFVLVCAAMGCPPLRNEPYEGRRLVEQLDNQVRRFLENPQKFRIDRGTSTVYLSKILDWYGQDFLSQFGNSSFFGEHDPEEKAVLNFASGYLSPDDRNYLKAGSYSLSYLKYDWSLNEQSNSQ